MERLLTTQEAAELAGVGPTAIKRWADSGQLNCVRTAGGHRRFRESELSAFLNRSTASSVVGAASSVDGASEVEKWLQGTLEAESTQHVEARLMQLRAEYGAWHRAAEFLGKVLTEIGARWVRGDLSIMDEHLLSERLLRAFSRIGEAMPTLPDGATVLLTTVEGEEHFLGLALVELCMRESGMRTHWSGRSTPVDEVVAFIERGAVDIVAVSASIAVGGGTGTLGGWLDRVKPACEASGVELLVGGDGHWPDPLSFGVRLRSFSELRAFLVGRSGRASRRR